MSVERFHVEPKHTDRRRCLASVYTASKAEHVDGLREGANGSEIQTLSIRLRTGQLNETFLLVLGEFAGERSRIEYCDKDVSDYSRASIANAGCLSDVSLSGGSYRVSTAWHSLARLCSAPVFLDPGTFLDFVLPPQRGRDS